MKAVVGKEALCMVDHLYLASLEQFESKFMAQGPYEAGMICESLDLAYLRAFLKKCLEKVDKKMLSQPSRRAGRCKG